MRRSGVVRATGTAPPRQGPAPPEAEGLADGLRAVRLVAAACLALVVVHMLVVELREATFGVRDLGYPARGALVAAAGVATLWGRPRLATALTGVVVALVFVRGPSAVESYLLVITAVVAAVLADRRQLGLVALGHLAYGVCFGVQQETTYPGEGWIASVVVLTASALSFAAGLLARWSLQARDRRRARVRELEEENARIRSEERARLADDLQGVVTGGLAAIIGEVDAASGRPDDVDGLRGTLVRVDAGSRALLVQLRALLDVLRDEPAPDAAARGRAGAAGPRRWVDALTARHVRLAAAAVLGLLAARAAAGVPGAADPSADLVQAAGLLACALAVWRPVLGAACAAAVVVAALALQARGRWDALPAALLCALGVLRWGPRRVWLVLLALGAWSALILLTDPTRPGSHVVLVVDLGVLAVLVGLAVRHFAEARDDALRRLADLADERDRVGSQERSAVARELHDVVGHQLSITTMLVMATSSSDDPTALTGSLERVRRCTAQARSELGVLLHALRGADADRVRSAPLVTPSASALALAGELSENGHHPVLAVDPAADALDPTTQRTLARVMQEATTNILRYAPPGSPCHYALAVDDTRVHLRVASPLAADGRGSDLSLGWGLRGVRERVDMTGGTFTGGPDRGRWVVAVTLPLPVDAPRDRALPGHRGVRLPLPGGSATPASAT